MLNIALVFIKNFLRSPQKEWRRFDSFFAYGGIIIAVAVLSTAISLFEGYERTLKDTILSVNSHLYIFRQGSTELTPTDVEHLSTFLDKQSAVISHAPVVTTQVMAVNQKRIKGAALRGINWQQVNPPSTYQKFVKEGTHQLVGSDVVIGSKLAKHLNIKIGEKIKITNPAQSKYTLTGLKSATKYCRVVGLYTSGMHEYDSSFIFANASTASLFSTSPHEFNILEIKLKNKWIDKAAALAYDWDTRLGYEYQVHSWIYYNSTVFSLLTLEKWMLFIILSFLVLIASFQVVSSVSTQIIEKQKDIGILMTYGASARLIKAIFTGRLLLFSAFAISIGLLLGIGLSYLASVQSIYQLKGEVYFLDQLTVRLRPQIMLLIFSVAMSLVYLSSRLPLKKISKLSIINIIRK